MKKKYIWLLIATIFLAGCSYLSLTIVHTEGKAKDIIDKTETDNTTVSPNISVPISGV